MKDQDLYDMILHEEIKIKLKELNELIITRVIGGWIYTRVNYAQYNYGPGKEKLISSVFVPEPNQKKD